MTKEIDENKPIMTQIVDMEVGETLLLPGKMYLTVRANLTGYKMKLGRDYSTHVNSRTNKFEVTRKS